MWKRSTCYSTFYMYKDFINRIFCVETMYHSFRTSIWAQDRCFLAAAKAPRMNYGSLNFSGLDLGSLPRRDRLPALE